MKKNSFVEGTLIATIAIVLVKILGMLYVIPFYNIVGSDGGALYSYAYNIYLIFLSISSAGLPNAISKVISEYDTLGYNNAKHKAYNVAKKLILFISIIGFFILFIFAEGIGMFIIKDLDGINTYKDVAFVIRCVSPAILVIPFLSITRGYLQGHKYVSPSSISQLIEQVVRIIVILLGSYLVLNVFNGKLSLAVGIAVSGAFVGGLFAYIYLRYIMIKNKKDLESDKNSNEVISTKEITKKIIMYAIPFIIINLVTDLYNFTDQILILRTIEKMGYQARDVEFIASAIATWAPKICMIINAMAMGMTISIIPNIVEAHTKKDKKLITENINKSVSMVTYISIPLTLGLAILATPVWRVFYDTNPYGGMILRLAVFSALFANIYMVTSTILQSLSRNKLVYVVSISGFLLNALLDIPLMYLMYYLGFEGFLGSIIASIIGFIVSISIGLGTLKIKDKIKFRESLLIITKTLVPSLAMVLVLLIINNIIPFNDLTRIGSIIHILVDVIIGAPIFILISQKLGLLESVFGRELLQKIVNKITFGKVNI